MTIQEALKILDGVCAKYKGTRADHVAMQQALQVVEKECSRIDPPDPTEQDEKQPDGNK